MKYLLPIVVELYLAKVAANSKLNDLSQETGYSQNILIRDCLAEGKALMDGLQPTILTWTEGVHTNRKNKTYNNHLFEITVNVKGNFALRIKSPESKWIGEFLELQHAQDFAEMLNR